MIVGERVIPLSFYLGNILFESLPLKTKMILLTQTLRVISIDDVDVYMYIDSKTKQ